MPSGENGDTSTTASPFTTIRYTEMKQKKVKMYGSVKLKKTPAWEAFARYIRTRDPACVTCGSQDDPSCGHYIAASICGKELYFSEINNNRQCSWCNTHGLGNVAAYTIYLERKYGSDIKEKLEAIRLKEKNAGIICRFSSDELEVIKNTYRQKLADLVNLS